MPMTPAMGRRRSGAMPGARIRSQQTQVRRLTLLSGGFVALVLLAACNSSTAQTAPIAHPRPTARPRVTASPPITRPPVAAPFAGLPQVGVLLAGPSVHGNHFCSASVVHSPAGNVIATAAHCVSGTGAGLLFAPGY